MDKKRTPNSKKKPKRDNSKENKSKPELKALYDQLVKEELEIDRQIEQFRSKSVSLDLTPQMNALHDYNEMKDLAQLVMGYLADAENVSFASLHKRYNLPTD